MYSARTDLQTLLENHDFSANAELSSNPEIILISEAHPSAHPSDGLITISSENLTYSSDHIDYRTETYTIKLIIEIDGQTTDTKHKAILEEIRNAFDTNNKSANRTYQYNVLYNFNGIVKYGRIEALVTAVQIWVAI